MVSQNEIAGYMGYLSIAFWLCAQLPQVFKNATLKSCEGLALPFLVNWLFVDITNLVGCLLTDQLPFQKYLAAYFCVIDFTLLIQFFHYKPAKPTTHTHHHGHHHPSHPQTAYSTFIPTVNSGASLHTSLILPHRSSSRPGTSRTRSTSTPALQPLTTTPLPHLRSGNGLSTIDNLPSIPDSTSNHTPTTARPKLHTRQTTHGSSSTLDSTGVYNTGFQTDGSYAALYEAALDVARVAERVNMRNNNRSSRSRRRVRLSRQPTNETEGEMEDDHIGQGMMDSFHSEMSNWTNSSNEGNVQSRGLGDRSRMIMSTPALHHRDRHQQDGRENEDGRGRSLQRRGDSGISILQSGTASELEDHHMPLITAHSNTALAAQDDRGESQRQRDKSRSLSLARGSSGRGGRRAAGVAFMSLGLIFRGYYSTTNLSTPVWAPLSPAIRPTGRIIASAVASPSIVNHRYPAIHSVTPVDERGSTIELYFTSSDEEKHKPHSPEPDPSASWSYDRIIGRISAWCCTTLYLTSRLPQIWKNFKRRSVEGLSILLFLFAFCGNSFYVASILLNPSGNADPADAGHYLMESLPYLLGSGGTLIFDLTIMIQSKLYGSSPPLPTPHEQHKRLRIPNRKRMSSARFIEEGLVPHSYTDRMDRNGGERDKTGGGERDRVERGERTPLLVNTQLYDARPSRERERSWSPDVRIRLTPASVVQEHFVGPNTPQESGSG